MTTTVTTMTTATTGTGSGSVVATAGLAATTTAAMPRLQGGFTFPSVPTSGVVASSGVPVPGAVPSIPMGYGNAYPVMTSMQCGYGFGYSAASPSGVLPITGIRNFGAGINCKEISNKPPVMKGSFDLYAVQLKTFLTRLGLWGVVDGSEIRPLFDVDGQAVFDARDNAARDAILRGVPDADAERICHEASAKDMWTRFEDKQTKREYANYIFAREQMYSNKYTSDVKLSDWLRDMELQKRELQHYGKMISDEEFAEILLSNVSRTHRELAPTAAQVMNALRAEEDLDEKIADEAPRSSINSTQKKPNGTNNKSAESSGKNDTGKGKRQRGRGRYKSKGQNQDSKTNAGGSGKSSQGCWNCGDLNHIRANCPTAKPKEGSQGQKQPAISEYKRWQNKKGGDGKKSIDALTVRKISATAIGARPRKADITEWVLDTATDVHVCTDMNLMMDPQPDRQHLFLDFDGQPKGERLIGDVRILVNIEMTNQDEVLTLAGTVHTPTGPDNLLSSHLLEEDGWEMHFKREAGESICLLKKGDLRGERQSRIRS
ncbi:hypothetical protein PR003_g18478 [Phytophthora rubi]|uniref:CCHC-type domain-containing protein n=1 Tax=Phytophthora rubi TaxID=129364 RepID=A0A6A4E5V0_9STRA|nr:hypothetical protein PR003_g18478 [Phytophthora rubi]